MSITLTKLRTVELLEEAVRSRGKDYIYPRDQRGWSDPTHSACVYSLTDGTPACIVGEVMHRLSPDLLPDNGWVINAGDLVHNYEGNDLLDGDELDEVATLLTRIQERQDDGWTWGNAVHDTLLEHGLDALITPEFRAYLEAA